MKDSWTEERAVRAGRREDFEQWALSGQPQQKGDILCSWESVGMDVNQWNSPLSRLCPFLKCPFLPIPLPFPISLHFRLSPFSFPSSQFPSNFRQFPFQFHNSRPFQQFHFSIYAAPSIALPALRSLLLSVQCQNA